MESYPLVLGISLFSVCPCLSYMVGALASWLTLRGHLSLLDATVGMVSHFVPLVEWRAHWEKGMTLSQLVTLSIPILQHIG